MESCRHDASTDAQQELEVCEAKVVKVRDDTFSTQSDVDVWLSDSGSDRLSEQ